MKLIGIIGDPIRHSLSPFMHNAVLQAMKLPLVYLPFWVRSQGLKKFLKAIPDLKLVGFNVTIPHKEKILPYIDHLSSDAAAIGAVNTVVIKGKKLFGHNTDWQGYLRSLEEEMKFKPQGKTVLILGGGGAARAVLYGLLKRKVREVILSNRTESKAEKLAREFQKKFPHSRIRTIPLTSSELKKNFPSVDVMINATSVGLKGTRFLNLPLKQLKKNSIVSDLVYRPLWTPLLQEARKLGLRPHSGLGMLLYQGVESFTLWTGHHSKIRAKIKIMRKALLDALQ